MIGFVKSNTKTPTQNRAKTLNLLHFYVWHQKGPLKKKHFEIHSGPLIEIFFVMAYVFLHVHCTLFILPPL